MVHSGPGSGDTPDWIGPYRLLERLGEGGMGEVWLAEQADPVHRRVALKVIKQGMDTRQVLARLEAERQALAVMDHPNIASFFDGGVTETGRPYFVMELVPGIPITDYADTHRLSTTERLHLFIDVCRAVQHAHQKGVIHRDLKPSNVLVTVKESGPVVKIIDFGIAKALGHDLTERTLITRVGQIVGTPEYMSPEQAEMSELDVDTRTDIYSLGVMLYELLVGALPFDLRARADHAIRHAIRETEIPRPSTRLSNLEGSLEVVLRVRGTTFQALRKELRNDLDWIILKAMEKDRTRRYDTANGLAEELIRHLRSEPILAHAPSAQYRIKKFAARHRAGVAFGAVILCLLATSAVGFRIQASRVARERDRAEREAAAAKQVSDFLVELFEVNDPSEARGNTITAREVLDRGAQQIREDLADQPEVQGRLMDAIGRVYSGLGLYTESGSLLEEAVEVRRKALGNEDEELAQTLASLATQRLATGRAAEALPLAKEAHAICLGAMGPEDPMTGTAHRLLGWVYQWLGELEKAQVHLDRALPIIQNGMGPDHIETAKTLYRLAWQYRLLGRFEEAREQYERAIPIVEREMGPDSPLLAAYLEDLGIVCSDLQDDSATAYYERALAIREKALGPDHSLVASTLNNLGVQAWESGNLAQARQYYERALRIKEKAFGPDNPNLSPELNNLGLVHQSEQDYPKALEYYERALAIRENALGPSHPDVANSLMNLGYLLRYVGMTDAARSMLERSIAIIEERLGPDHPDLTTPLANLGILLSDAGDPQGARVQLERLLDIDEKTFGADHETVGHSLRLLVNIVIDLGDLGTADSLLTRWETIEPEADGHVFERGRLALGRGDRTGAEHLFARWLDLREADLGPESAELAYSQARCKANLGDYEGALELLEVALQRGYADPRLVRNLEFSALHGTPRFEALVEEVLKRAGVYELARDKG